MSIDVTTTRTCGCLGCPEPAAALIDHPRGRRVVCKGHVGGHEVIRDVR